MTWVSAGPPLGGLYLKPPSRGGLCDGVTTIPSARSDVRAAIVGEDGMRDDGRRRVAVAVVDQDVHPVRREHLDGARPGGVGERVGVGPEEERPGDGMLPPVVADGLGDGEDVVLH